MAEYQTLPKYLKRDLRRIYGKIKQVPGIPETPDLFVLAVRLRLRQGADAVVADSWQWRHAFGFPLATVRKLLAKRGLEVTYQRRGDLIFITETPS